MEKFPDGTTLAELYTRIVGGIGGSGITRGRTLGIENLRKRKHASLLSTLKRLRDDQILTVYPPSSIDDEGSLAWADTDPKKYREPRRNKTRADWVMGMSAVGVVPNLSRLKTAAGSQASRFEECTITLRKKGEAGSSIVVEGLTQKPLRLS